MILFIADYFDTLGGAEQNDSVLLEHLQNKFEVKTMLSHEVTTSNISEAQFLIIGNFTGLKRDVLNYITDNKSYIIYEHDHKYVSTRDPSRFKDFKIPQSQLINGAFYESAKKIICLGTKQVDIIRENLNIDDSCVSIGTSLWSTKRLDLIEELSKASVKSPKAAISRSNNPIKNTDKSIKYCQSKSMDYDLISSPNPEEFLSTLAKYESLVFFPGVLESLCRLVVEAKMLGCNIITTPRLLGAAYEDWFQLKGPELIGVIRDKVKNALALFCDIVEKNTETKEDIIDDQQLPRGEITAILTCYRRPEYLKEQVESLREQTAKPREIWLWVNSHEDNEGYDFSDLNVDKIFHNDFNWKFHGRFAAAQLCRTKFVALFDDDTIPGPRWFENCLVHNEKNPGLYGGVGVILGEKRYYGHQRVGWSNPNESLVEVDLVGHAWFIEKKNLQYMWREEPFTWENGEDIQLSYLCKKYGNIKTYVPPHPTSNTDFFSSLKGMKYGVDEKATSRPSNHKVFYNERDAQVATYIDSGWKTVRGID